jgi:hypothetical protein
MSWDNWTLNTAAVMADASLNRCQTIRGLPKRGIVGIRPVRTALRDGAGSVF